MKTEGNAQTNGSGASEPRRGRELELWLLGKTAGALRRVVNRLERRVLPEATSAEDQWQRVVMNQAVDAHIASLEPARLSAAEISGETHAGKGWKSYRSLHYPDFDLCAPVPDDLRFDVVICEQVLEHVPDPWLAVRNLRRLCRPGGHVIVTSPFLIKVHEIPIWDMRDYWRFTPRGLRTLLHEAGLRVETIGQWGNRQCVTGNLRWWPAYRPWLSLDNGRDIPVQIWAFARNPAR